MTNHHPHTKKEIQHYWVRWLFRVIAAAAILQAIGGLVAMLTVPYQAWWVAIWVVLAFATSALLLWKTQPQFSALFGLFASSYSEPILKDAEQFHLPLAVLIPVLLWALLFQHPVELPQQFRQAGLFGLSAAVALSLAMAMSSPDQPFGSAIAIAFYASAGLALVLLTQRCISVGLHRSPRTLIFAISLAPLVVGILVQYMLGLDEIAEAAKAIVAVCFTIAPIGTLLSELAHKTSINPSSATEEYPLEHHR